MNPSKLIHTVTGERLAVSFSAGKRGRTWAATNSGSSISVLVEGLSSRTKQAVVGHIPMPRYRMTWEGSADIEEGDRITYSGNKYHIMEITDDTTRPTGPYKTGILSAKPID